MNIKMCSTVLLSGALSFVVGISIVTAQNCSTVGTPCPGWGAGSTQAQQTGYCCVAQTNASTPCTAGKIKSVTIGGGGCGQLQLVQGGNCSGTNAGPCGVVSGQVGCTTANCPGS